MLKWLHRFAKTIKDKIGILCGYLIWSGRHTEVSLTVSCNHKVVLLSSRNTKVKTAIAAHRNDKSSDLRIGYPYAHGVTSRCSSSIRSRRAEGSSIYWRGYHHNSMCVLLKQNTANVKQCSCPCFINTRISLIKSFQRISSPEYLHNEMPNGIS